MLLRCCLMYITIIILIHILCLVYLFPHPDLGQVISNLFDLFFISSFIFSLINYITSLMERHLFFVQFLECLPLISVDNVHEEFD